MSRATEDPVTDMSIVKDIIDVAKDIEARAKDRRDIDQLRQIHSLALSLQSNNAEVVERDIRVMQEIAQVKAENAKLKEDLAKANSEDVRIARGIEFRRGARTGNQWLPFCPKCKNPAIGYGEHRMGCSDRECAWEADIRLHECAGVIAGLG